MLSGVLFVDKTAWKGWRPYALTLQTIEWLKKIIKSPIRKCGFDIVRYKKCESKVKKNLVRKKNKLPYTLSPNLIQGEFNTITAVQPYTMTSPERLLSLIKAVQYVVKADIKGDIVECGVWKGGSIMAVILTLVKLGRFDRNIYLFDTFEGMPKPSEKDKTFTGIKASKIMEEESNNKKTNHIFAYAPLKEVQKRITSLGYDNKKIHFVKGKVETTLQKHAPDCISLLRLDTDWYESTRHELVHLYPRLQKEGVIIIDDYCYWKGAKLATDEYINQNAIPILLNHIDGEGVIGVKIRI